MGENDTSIEIPPPQKRSRHARRQDARATIAPRCLDREQSAIYLGEVSVDVVDRLIHAGKLPVVRLPIERHRQTGKGVPGVSRRVLIDVRDLDALIERSKERVSA